MEKAKQLAQDLNEKDFDSTNGSFERRKERNNIKFKKLNGEKQDAYYFGTESWIRDAPPAVTKDHEAKDIHTLMKLDWIRAPYPRELSRSKIAKPQHVRWLKNWLLFCLHPTWTEREAEATYYFKKQKPTVFQER
ncbi:hypothetical protein RF11_16228 [Thelohanellus kitauei]|uniref:Uncharacterized protein n=1 Tax=Thelohanellus kitauei TaxID=669202 RepID=A0A0C2MDP1_THEKT|nr:hypothetical protein RF11_16228 [Thelohanellus kitauei]